MRVRHWEPNAQPMAQGKMSNPTQRTCNWKMPGAGLGFEFE